jgi:hypothetical protein
VQQADTLQLLAELAVAFAGFTGLVGAFRMNRADDESFRGELRLLIEFSVYLMLSSLVPLFLWNAGLSESTSWRSASFAHVVFVIVYYVRGWRWLRAHAAASRNAGGFVATFAVELSLAALLLANGFGALPWAPHVAYLGSLFYQLVGTSLSFMRFASPLWRDPAA